MNKERIFSSIVVAVVGIFYILAPYETKAAWSIDFGLTPSVLVLLGILLVIVALYNLFTGPVAKTKTRQRAARKRRVKRRR